MLDGPQPQVTFGKLRHETLLGDPDEVYGCSVLTRTQAILKTEKGLCTQSSCSENQVTLICGTHPDFLTRALRYFITIITAGRATNRTRNNNLQTTEKQKTTTTETRTQQISTQITHTKNNNSRNPTTDLHIPTYGLGTRKSP